MRTNGQPNSQTSLDPNSQSITDANHRSPHCRANTMANANPHVTAFGYANHNPDIIPLHITYESAHSLSLNSSHSHAHDIDANTVPNHHTIRCSNSNSYLCPHSWANCIEPHLFSVNLPHHAPHVYRDCVAPLCLYSQWFKKTLPLQS